MLRTSKFFVSKDSLEFRNQFETLHAAWMSCTRPDWMLQVADGLGIQRDVIIKCKAECAKTAMRYVKDDRSIQAIFAASKYGAGEIPWVSCGKLFEKAGDAVKEADNADERYYPAQIALSIIQNECENTAEFVYKSIAVHENPGSVKRIRIQMNDVMCNICRLLIMDQVIEMGSVHEELESFKKKLWGASRKH